MLHLEPGLTKKLQFIRIPRWLIWTVTTEKHRFTTLDWPLATTVCFVLNFLIKEMKNKQWTRAKLLHYILNNCNTLRPELQRSSTFSIFWRFSSEIRKSVTIISWASTGLELDPGEEESTKRFELKKSMTGWGGFLGDAAAGEEKESWSNLICVLIQQF